MAALDWQKHSVRGFVATLGKTVNIESFKNERRVRTYKTSQADHTQAEYRLYDFTKAQLIRPNVAHCIAGRISCASKRYLVRAAEGTTW
jgi:hypothetical protein